MYFNIWKWKLNCFNQPLRPFEWRLTSLRGCMNAPWTVRTDSRPISSCPRVRVSVRICFSLLYALDIPYHKKRWSRANDSWRADHVSLKSRWPQSLGAQSWEVSKCCKMNFNRMIRTAYRPFLFAHMERKGVGASFRFTQTTRHLMELTGEQLKLTEIHLKRYLPQSQQVCPLTQL